MFLLLFLILVGTRVASVEGFAEWRLKLAYSYGIICRMSEMRKITAFVPAQTLAAAQAHTGEGVTETLRIALEKLAHQGFYQRMLAARGKFKFDGPSIAELREDREFDEHGNVVDRG
jgi:hypothetical protein